MKGVVGYHSSQAYQLGVYVNLIRDFAGEHWVPDEIGIEYLSVPIAVRDLFPNTRILTHQRTGYIAFPRDFLCLAPPHGGCEEDAKDPLLLTEKFDYVDTLRALLKSYLSDCHLSAPLAASLMDTSVRTLSRRLSAAGTTYHAVVDELRFDSARQLLEHTNERIIDIADAVGFKDSAHFARMFRRISGLSPREFRVAVKG